MRVLVSAIVSAMFLLLHAQTAWGAIPRDDLLRARSICKGTSCEYWDMALKDGDWAKLAEELRSASQTPGNQALAALAWDAAGDWSKARETWESLLNSCANLALQCDVALDWAAQYAVPSALASFGSAADTCLKLFATSLKAPSATRLLLDCTIVIDRDGVPGWAAANSLITRAGLSQSQTLDVKLALLEALRLREPQLAMREYQAILASGVLFGGGQKEHISYRVWELASDAGDSALAAMVVSGVARSPNVLGAPSASLVAHPTCVTDDQWSRELAALRFAGLVYELRESVARLNRNDQTTLASLVAQFAALDAVGARLAVFLVLDGVWRQAALLELVVMRSNIALAAGRSRVCTQPGMSPASRLSERIPVQQASGGGTRGRRVLRRIASCRYLNVGWRARNVDSLI
jgi:hypothetical protein